MKTIQHRFVEFIPEILEEGILYISIEYRTAVHLCICGCGNKVVTPFSPTGWKLIFEGKYITLSPSIGNWNFDCKSHYFITKNQIRVVRRWSDFESGKGKKTDKMEKIEFSKCLKK